MEENTQKKQPVSPVMLILVGLLVIGAFAIGNMYTRINQLETAENYPSQPTGNIAGAQEAPEKAQPPVDSIEPVSEQDHVRGAEDAQITLIEYSDFECPFCGRFHPTMEQVMEEYDGQVRWVYRHFPLASHANAQMLAEASECVAEQAGNAAFWQFADEVLTNIISNESAVLDLAPTIGVDRAVLETCINSGKYTERIQEDYNSGSKAGITGTPGTFLVTADGQVELISGALPYASVKQILDKYLQ
jgi:protein-disulfide isomerase